MEISLINGVVLALAGYLLLVALLVRAVKRKQQTEFQVARQSSKLRQAIGRSPSWLDCLKISGVYWGVRIQVQEGAGCCHPMQPLMGQTFPLANAPMLPLPQCENIRCRCYFQPLVERRTKRPRRLNPDRRMMLRYEPLRPSRRHLHDRRQPNRAFREEALHSH